MRILQCLSVAILLFCLSCNNSTPKAADKKVEKGPLSSNLSAAGTTKMMSLVTKYYGLKNALVASDEAKTAAQSNELMNEARGMSTFLSADQANKLPLQPYLDTVIMQTQIIAGIKDNTCEKQRLAFSGISTAMYAMLKQAGLKNGGVHKQYCPMAFNDKGAYWLSEEEKIKNPYFGKKMLECGEVQESF